jgi:hypothetical protein
LKYKKEKYLKNRAHIELKDEIYGYFLDFVEKKFDNDKNFEKFVNSIAKKKADPYSLSLQIIKNLNIRI